MRALFHSVSKTDDTAGLFLCPKSKRRDAYEGFPRPPCHYSIKTDVLNVRQSRVAIFDFDVLRRFGIIREMLL